MVNGGGQDRDARAAERALAIGYAPAERRAALTGLLALDDALGGILRATREPLAGQLRLAWWRDALLALDSGQAAGEPVLAAIARDVLPAGVTGAELAGMVDGWEALLVERLDEAAVRTHARARGGGLFVAGATMLGGDDPRARAAGEGWALADLAGRLSDGALAAPARELADERLAEALTGRWNPPLRALGALAWLARLDLLPDSKPAGHPARVARLLRFRVFGR